MTGDKDVYCNRKDSYLTTSRAEITKIKSQNQFTDDKITKHNQSVEWRRDFYFLKTAKSHHRVD